MLQIWLISLGILLLALPSHGQERCLQIFQTPSTSEANSTHWNELLYAVETDHPLFLEVVNRVILRAARNPDMYLEIDSAVDRIRVLSAQFSGAREAGGLSKIRNAELVTYLLKLVQDRDLTLWKAVLVHDMALMQLREFGNYGTMGHLLTTLPQAKKDELLAYLGEVYTFQKNRALLQPVHLLLDPKNIYDSFKSRGKTDREFYVHYLDLIKQKVFPRSEVGGYGGELVLRIAQLIQKDLVQNDVGAVNFFGSVPNGFAKRESDLDIFNHPLEGGEAHRHQLTDRRFQRDLDDLLRFLPWQWEGVSDTKISPPEHFGGNRHVFSFHITQQRIVLRFYYQKLSWNEQGMPVVWQHLDLDMGI